MATKKEPGTSALSASLPPAPPKPLDPEELAKAFADAEHTSKAFADVASKISNFVAEFERRLCAFPGKLPVQVENLRFDRHGDGWALVLTVPYVEPRRSTALVKPDSSTTQEIRLTDAPLEKKVETVGLFRDLLQKMMTEQQSKMGRMEAAVKVLEEVVQAKPGKKNT